MGDIEFDHATIKVSDEFSLQDISWKIAPADAWAIVGTNGSGKSSLAAALAGQGELSSGSVNNLPDVVGLVSLESQAALIERERLRDDSDLTDEISEGTLVQEMLDETCIDAQLQARLIEIFHLQPLMNRGFRKLSTGETRKALLCRVLCNHPELLILDEPFEGLDAQTVPLVRDILADISKTIPMVLVFNRFDELPNFVTGIACLEAGKLAHVVNADDAESVKHISQLLHLKRTDLTVPEAANDDSTLDPNQPLVDIKSATIRYGNNTVFTGLNWRVDAGKHWQLTGPNGSGKTCLLNLISGDHPQCYNNDMVVFGYQRGSGESIWDIKQHIGYVSTSLQWEYRVSSNLLNVILSGFYDSIGLYTTATDKEKQIAIQWLALLALDKKADQPFSQLSYGDQRLLLIARAMVKHPPLLILDEPCLGLDDINRQLILALIEKICAGSKTTVLYVNHHANDKIEGIHNYLTLPNHQEKQQDST